MAEKALRFRHEVIDADPPGARHDVTLLADFTGDGRTDIMIAGCEGDVNVFWYENPSWARHDIAHGDDLEAGGVVCDITGRGRPDVVIGQQGGGELYWFECPDDPRGPWKRRLIENRFKQYHDQAFADIDGDGKPELIFFSQYAYILAYYDIPEDPTVEPWPRECCHMIAEELEHRTEGLAVLDFDGDGVVEIIGGPNIFRPPAEAGGKWRRERIAVDADLKHTRVAAADIDGDGKVELIFSEGESNPGRLAICRQPDRQTEILADDLFHPHSLAVADFDGDGLPDIFTAEMGLGGKKDSRMIIFLNRGGGRFEKRVISTGVPAHEAKVADLTGDGRPDIVSKPYDPERHIDVFFNRT